MGKCISKLASGKDQKSSGFFSLLWLLLSLGLLYVTTGPSLWLGLGLCVRVATVVLLGIPASIAGEILS